ncbi:MAG: Rne/Rng family ribonuclease [Armatimonadota bacterium]|nr:Rne/Rng family ribonuclease [Armatimonadota bacterium]MDR7439169.1 Rne/Rng family ribonuclease [Armatimonadota bacterium]MDR7563812.1 Rne/Rng family ribonuclease [Armatimonadota bacterium]MDR7567781.1 Rne/Rng family ribonuclease [Armatimonadota bacterium]MDR7600878.1 Rne/Rng family ribonuclease [Armatimonadota bacterium]
MKREIFANVNPFEVRVAVREDGVLVNLFIERDEPVVGNIYKGRVANVLRGMDAAFVDIGLARNAFLHVSDVRAQRIGGEDLEDAIGRGAIQHRLRPGQEIIVQVTKEPTGTKGARVTTYVALPAYYLVLMPTVSYVGVSRKIESEAERRRLREIAERIRPAKMGLIVRTAAQGASERDLQNDLRYLLSVWNRVLERARQNRAPALLYQDLRLIRRVVRDLFTEEVSRFVVDSPREYEQITDLVKSYAPHLRSRLELYEGESIFEHFGIEREIQNALRRKVWLPSGGYLVIDRTEAFTVVDVNTGKYVGKTDLETTIFNTNLEAAREVVRQIRLRDIGGIILVDFIDMENEQHRRQVLRALEEALRADRARTHLIDLTQLGLVELTRKRVYQDLEHVLRVPCPYCEGRGRVLSPRTVANQIRRELPRTVRASQAPGVVVHVHPLVHAELFRDGEAWLKSLEEATGRQVRCLAREGIHLEEIEILPAQAEGVPAGRGEVRRLEVEEEVLDVADEQDEVQERAAAFASARNGWWGRLRGHLERLLFQRGAPSTTRGER